MDFHAVADGELLVVRDGVVAPFSDLQQRLNRKSPNAKMLADYPVAVRLYDLLFEGARIFAPCPSMPAGRGWRPGMGAGSPRGWTSRR